MKNLNIHGTFQMQKSWFTVEKVSLDFFFMFFKIVIFETVPWKLFDYPNMVNLCMTSLQKYPFGNFIF